VGGPGAYCLIIPSLGNAVARLGATVSLQGDLHVGTEFSILSVAVGGPEKEGGLPFLDQQGGTLDVFLAAAPPFQGIAAVQDLRESGRLPMESVSGFEEADAAALSGEIGRASCRERV